MKNPYDIKKEKDKYDFFEQMTSAIALSVEEWLLNKHPSFDKKLEDKINEISRLQNEFKLLINDIKLDTRNTRQKETEYFKESIDKFIKKTYPEISHSIVDTARKLKAKAKNLEEREKTLDKNLSKSIRKMLMSKIQKAFEDEN